MTQISLPALPASVPRHQLPGWAGRKPHILCCPGINCMQPLTWAPAVLSHRRWVQAGPQHRARHHASSSHHSPFTGQTEAQSEATAGLKLRTGRLAELTFAWSSTICPTGFRVEIRARMAGKGRTLLLDASLLRDMAIAECGPLWSRTFSHSS